MNCPHCQTKNPAVARFCIYCGQTLIQNCSSCQTELPTDARFCMHCGQPVIMSTRTDDARLTRLAATVPNSLVKKLRASAHLQGERRVVTALFVDVVGSTGLSQQVDVETWTAIMNGAFDRMAPIIFSYEGTIARLLGDSLLAFFGAPVAHEDDPIRAVRSALALISAGYEYAVEVHREFGVEFKIRVCINTGQVIIGAFQEDLQYEFTAMGAAINLVSRIMFAAQPMTVLVSEKTYPFIAQVFDCADLGPVSIKGIKEPMHVYQVHGPKVKPGQMRGLGELQSPMVGREAELTALTRLCDTVQAGIGRVVMIVGDPGLGKTRLISEWNTVAGVRCAQSDTGVSSPALLWVEGRCLSFGQGFAYHLLIDLIRSIIRVPDAAGEEKTHTTLRAFIEDLFGESVMDVYPYLGHLLSLNLKGAALERVQLGDPQALRTQYLNAIRRLLQALSTRSPVVMVLEDLHWADPSSTGLLGELLRLVSSTPILFCLVTRPDFEAPGWKLVTAARELLGDSLTELTLNALSESDSQKLVANLLEIEALPSSVRKNILKKSDGNPFFVEEVIRMMIDQGAIVQNYGNWIAGKEIERVEIPDNLQGLLLARIDRLPEDVKSTLRVASVIGRKFPKKVLAIVGRGGCETTLSDRLNTLESSGLIRLTQLEPDLEYLFRHALVQDAAYTSLLTSDQKQLHLAVGAAVEHLYPDQLEENAAMLARHFERAGEDHLAYKYFSIAAEASLDSYANQEAEGQFRSALSLSTKDTGKATLLVGLGEALYRQSRFVEAIQTWGEGIKLFQSLGDLEGTAQLFARSARVAWHNGDTPESLRLSQKGLAAVDGAPESPDLAFLMHEAARACLFNGLPDDALSLCRSALEMAERLGAVGVQADALATFGVLPDQAPEEVLEALSKSVELADTFGLLRIGVRAHHNSGVMISGIRGDQKAARQHYLKAAEIAKKRGVVSEELFSLVNATEISLGLGKSSDVEEKLKDLERLLNAISDPAPFQSAIASIKIGLLWMRGEWDQAFRLARISQIEARQRGDLQRLSDINNYLISGLLELDQRGELESFEELEALLSEVVEIGERGLGGKVGPYCQMSILCSRQGRIQDATHWLTRAREASKAQPSVWNDIAIGTAEVEKASAEKRWSEALTGAEKLAGEFARISARWNLVRTLQDWAEIHISRGEPSDLPRALALFREALVLFDEMGAFRHKTTVEDRLQMLRSEVYSQALAYQKDSKELAQAGKIQASFLPEELPHIPGWHFSASLTPARETSGDFYDFIFLPDGKLGIVIADVADKGAAAALYMASSRTLIHTFALDHPDSPEHVIGEANRRITLDTHQGLFITVFYGVLDPINGTLTYCNAGHNPPFLLRTAGDSEIQKLTRTGVPMGIVSETSWEKTTLQLYPGDVLVLYTDGVTDAINQRDDFFGEEKLISSAQSTIGGTAQFIHDAIQKDIRVFVSDTPQFDDITLLVLVRDRAES